MYNYSNADGSQQQNFENISFKGAEIADIMGLGAELERYEREHGKIGGENTLDFSFNKESSLPGTTPPEFGGATQQSSQQ